MAIANSYFNSSPITDSDIFVGTKYATNRTVNYTAQSIADYLNINSRISISGQLTFKFTILPNVAKTIAFENGGGDGRLFSSIDKLIVSILDAGGSNITVFLDYLIDSEILLAEQNQPNSFGHYKITSYTVTANPNFYELNLEYIGGNGNIYKDVYYDMTPWASSGSGGGGVESVTGITVNNADPLNPVVNVPTFQQVLTAGSTTNLAAVFQEQTNVQNTVIGTGFVSLSNTEENISTTFSAGGIVFGKGFINVALLFPDITTSYDINLPNKTTVGSYTIATLDDIPSYTTPTLQEVLTSGSSSNIGLNISGSNTNIYLEEGVISTGNLDENGGFVRLFSDGYIGLQTTLKDGVIEIYSNSNNNYSILIPEKATDSVETLAFTSDITTPTLQQVTTEGNETSNAIIVTDNSENETTLQYNGINFNDLDEGGNTLLRFINTSAVDQEIEVRGLGGTMALLSDIPAAGVTSVGLTMPSAFTVTNSPITSSGDIAVTGAGLVSQYIRGDGTLANFPSSSGGGSSVNYYLNGSVSQGTFGGTTYYQMSKTPILGAGTNFIRTNGAGNGYIASFITDAGDPNQLNIPGGNWNLEFYFNASSGGGSPSFYAELYKVSATNVFTLIASDSLNPEGITNGTTVDQYFTSIPVPQTSLLITDRLAIRIFVNTGGRTITLHTENGNLSEVLTTLTTGLTALNGLTAQVQNLATGTSGTDFGIVSSGSTHTFNLPNASASNRGALSSADWTTFNGKQNDLETFNRTQGVYYFQDFLNGPLVNQIEGTDISIRVTSGGGGGETISAAGTFPNRTSQQGVLQLTTGTSATGQLVIRVGSFNSATGMYFGNGEVVFEAYVNVETLSTAAQRFADFIGWSQAITVATVPCYQFVYDEGGVSTNGGAASPNWKCCSNNGTTRVNTDTGVPVVAGQWYKLRIVVNATNTQVNYLIDGTNVATHTSGVGNSAMAAKVIHNKSIGTTNRTFFIDYLMIKQIFTTPR